MCVRPESKGKAKETDELTGPETNKIQLSGSKQAVGGLQTFPRLE